MNEENFQSDQAKAARQILNAYEGELDIQIVPRNRARQMLETHPTACSPWVLKNAAREQLYNFSLPYMLESSLKLLVANESPWGKKLLQREQDTDTLLSLQQLLTSNTPPVLGIETGRSYGDSADKVIKPLIGSKVIYQRTSSTDNLAPLMPMLHHGYIDLMIEYDKIREDKKHLFSYLAFKETEPFQLVYFACSKSLQIGPLLNKLNDAIKKLSAERRYQTLILEHLPTEERDAAFRYWQQHLLPAPSTSTVLKQD
ncbi:hypothetical protein ACFOEE_17250 [Pseudoalteromonas fenneropenaei]|uniref:Solute-binding protein family 3/N-terminal domain-containing protein n=1 Tax=Pseudoalteromonas fenneropenaei TaxID=1737459 RepID=A0ABV7CPB3_9GAMM